MVRIIIGTIGGKKLPTVIENLEGTLLEFKMKINDVHKFQEEFDSELMNVIYKGTVYKDDEQKLSDLGLSDGSFLVIHFKKRKRKVLPKSAIKEAVEKVKDVVDSVTKKLDEELGESKDDSSETETESEGESESESESGESESKEEDEDEESSATETVYSGAELREAILVNPYILVYLIHLMSTQNPYIASYIGNNPTAVISNVNTMLEDPEFRLKIVHHGAVDQIQQLRNVGTLGMIEPTDAEGGSGGPSDPYEMDPSSADPYDILEAAMNAAVETTGMQSILSAVENAALSAVGASVAQAQASQVEVAQAPPVAVEAAPSVEPVDAPVAAEAVPLVDAPVPVPAEVNQYEVDTENVNTIMTILEVSVDRFEEIKARYLLFDRNMEDTIMYLSENPL